VVQVAVGGDVEVEREVGVQAVAQAQAGRQKQVTVRAAYGVRDGWLGEA
jgi:hypothetical protein